MRNRVKEYWKALGPGLTTGAADDDPSGIATYSQVGASHGFSFAWLSLFSFPLMAVVNEMCARIGIVTGIGLAENIKRYYSKKVLYICTFLLVFANVFNIGADLGAMGKATELLFPRAPFVVLVIFFAIVSLLLQVFIPYKKYSKYLKYLTFALFTYVLSAITLSIDWSDVLYHTIIPTMHFGREEIILVCAVLGTTISPYLFFWQTSIEVEEQIMKGETTEESRRANVTPKEIKDMRLDVWSGALVSNLVMFSIIAVCGAVLFKNGIKFFGWLILMKSYGMFF
jgi:NRAMP (natural resistance-associated macrophage protein)-like metal ion transporter